MTAKVIRFYERKRLLPPPTRAANGYRLYGDDAVEMLRFVKRATGLGLTLARSRRSSRSARAGGRRARTSTRLLRDKAAELDRKLEDIIEIRHRIRQSLRAWKNVRSRQAAVCAHIARP